MSEVGTTSTSIGRMFYPINVGKKDTDITSNYESRTTEFTQGDAFSNVSVNPQFKTTNLEYENSTTSTSWVNSANFIEIRNTSHVTGISNDNASGIVNRVYPTGTGLDTYAKNRDETNSFKVKVFDAQSNYTDNNKKLRYATSDTTQTIGLDIDNYDYFILINPDLTTAGTNRIRPHFAKITRITAFDEFGDGVEFEPSYPTSIAANSNFEIYKGPSKTDTSVVAVSYGLRGDTDANTSKYDVSQRATRPTFYFYNDRLDEKDQLDYQEKYTATSERWWDYSTEINVSAISAHTQYSSTTPTLGFLLAPTGDRAKLVEGQSIFDENDVFIGNVKAKHTSTNGAFSIDFARVAVSSFTATQSEIATVGTASQSGTPDNCTSGNYNPTGGSGSGAVLNITLASIGIGNLQSVQSITVVDGGSGYTTSDNLSVTLSGGNGVTLTIPVASVTYDYKSYKIGKTIQNTVFKTKAKYSNKVYSLGNSPISATIVDSNKTADESDNNFDPIRWNTAFPKMKRHSLDLLSDTAVTSDGRLTGPNRYITFEKADFKNNKVEPITSSSLNSPKNKLSQLARIQTSDNSGLNHLKIKEGDILKVRRNLHNGSFTKKNYFGLATSNNQTITMSELNSKLDLKHILSTDDIVEIDGNYLVVNVVGSKTSDTEQSFTVKDYKLIKSKTWTGNSSGFTIIRKPMKLTPYTGVLNVDFESDAEVKIDANGNFQTLTMDGVGVAKSDSKIHKAKFTPLLYNSHVIEIDYADRYNKYAKIIDADKTFYQKPTASASRMYYYQGKYSISEDVFNGEVDSIDVNTSDGFTTFKFQGRDDTSKFLGATIDKTLTQHSDIVKTTLAPIITNHSTITGISNVAVTTSGTNANKQITYSGTPNVTLKPFTLLLNSSGELIGEVSSATSGSIILSHRIINSPIGNTIRYFDPYSSTQHNQISGTKAMQSNIAHTGAISDFTSISEKGLAFKRGLDIDYDSSFTYTPLQLSSNVGSKVGDVLGYDISSPKSISTGDAIFAFSIGNENGVTLDKNDIMSVNSEMFDIVKEIKQDDSTTVLEIAPNFPMVLGRFDSNTSDTRDKNTSIYLVNSNIETGGFLHRIPDTLEIGGQIEPKETVRYWDLQALNPNALVRTYDSIYNVGKKPQSIQGYAIGYGVKATGDTKSITDTPTNKPKNGSNNLLGWNGLSSFYHASAPLPKSYPLDTKYWDEPGNDPYEVDIEYSKLEQIDPRTLNYELLMTGDIFPSSKLRHNSIFKHNVGFDNYGVLLETSPQKTGVVKHQHYDGATSETLKRNVNFELVNIKESTPNATDATNIRRWGVIRLVEATFDWHFNPIDFDSLSHVKDIPSVSYFDYHMIKPVATPNYTHSQLDDNDVKGDMFYKSPVLSSATRPSTEEHPDGDFILNSGEYGGLMAVSALEGFSQNGLTASVGEVLEFSADAAYTNYPIFGIETFRLFSAPNYSLDEVSTRLDGEDGSVDTFFVDKQEGLRDIRFHTNWLIRPPVSIDQFSHQNLKYTVGNSTQTYNPMNIILPLMAEIKDPTDKDYIRDMRYSPFHQIDGWNDDNINYLTQDSGIVRLHMSRVISAMVGESFDEGPTNTPVDKEMMGIGKSHVYDNCIGVFKDWIPASENTRGVEEITLSSSPLQLETQAKWSGYADDVTTTYDQHTQTARYWSFTNSVSHRYNLNNGQVTILPTRKVALLGTKTKEYPLKLLAGNRANLTNNNLRATNHAGAGITGAALNTGLMYATQMIVKPRFNLTLRNATGFSDAVTKSADSKTFTFTLGDNNSGTAHTWLSFMPDLTGYYLVSEKLKDGKSLSSANHHGIPKFITKILDHQITAPVISGGSAAWEKHVLTFDTAIDTANGNYYRLMKISERTFDDTPDKIEFNVLHDSGLKYDTTTNSFIRGVASTESSNTENQYYNEAVYSMYLKLDVDNAITANNPYLEARTTVKAVEGFTDEEVISAFVSDGNKKKRLDFTVSLARKKGTSKSKTEQCLVLTYDGKLSGSGVVSFGEIFNITLSRKAKLTSLDRCYIGTSFEIGSNVNTELNNIVKDAGLEYDFTKSNATFTSNIVNSNGTNTVVCMENVVGLSAGDVIYTEEGHVIGEILSINNQTITFASGEKFYSPPQYSNIIKMNEKTFVTNLKFDNTNVYTAINSLVQAKGMDYKIHNGNVIFRNFEDTSSLRRKEVRFEHLIGREPISNNVALFDKASKVIVNGNKVKGQDEDPTINVEKVVTINDSTIVTKEDADLKAMKVLQIHNGDSRKITLEIKKDGFELFEAGDILHLDFPNYKIPKGDYIIFEIENVLGPTMKLTVGSYSKGIAEILSGISQASESNVTSLLRENGEDESERRLTFFEDLNITLLDIEYIHRGALPNANIGFDDTVGFGETVGFDVDTGPSEFGILKHYKDRFYD